MGNFNKGVFKMRNLNEHIAHTSIRLKKSPFKKGDKLVWERGTQYYDLTVVEIHENTFFRCVGKEIVNNRNNPLNGKVIDFDGWLFYDGLCRPDADSNFRKQPSWEDDLSITETKKMIGLFFSGYCGGMYNLNPSYQRDLVWTKKQKEELIESIFQGKDTGVIVVLDAMYSSEHTHEVLDGKQRLSTIFAFMMNEFKYKGKTFSELSAIDKSKFEWHSLSFKVIGLRGRDFTEKEKVQLFVTMNTKGTRVSDKFLDELRKKYLEETNE